MELLKNWGFGGDTNDAKDAGLKVKEEDDAENKQELNAEMAKKFRGMAARVNYIGQDRSDLQFAAREVCREMAKPTVGGMGRLKKISRYLVGAERVVWRMGQGDVGDEPRIEVFVDSDWAKAEDRKSVSGGIILVGKVGVTHRSRTQATRALSSGEAE